MKIITLFFSVVVLWVATAWKNQDHTRDPKMYFGVFLNKNAFENNAMNQLPTLEQCKKVFTDSAATVYYNSLAAMKNAFTPLKEGEGETFVDVGYEKFTTEDVLAGKGNYAGGMEGIKSFLQPGVVFYKIEMLREKGAQQGMAYNCWVYLSGTGGGRWTFFPRPWRAFKK